MKINLTSFEETLDSENKLHQDLHLPPQVKLEIALDTIHALNDLTRSLAELHPHKRSIATLGALPEPLAKVALSFASQGYNVQEIPVSFLIHDEGALTASCGVLKKDTLFILCSQVEPFSGALYPIDLIRKEAAKKTLFTLIYQSPDGLNKGIIVPENPLEGVVVDPLWGDSSPLTLILKGDRCQGDKLLWGYSRYETSAIQKLREKILTKPSVEENKSKVIEFENEIKMHMGHTVHFLGDKILRIFDRAVIFVDGVDGEALTCELRKKNRETFTASACAWKTPHLNDWLPRLGINISWAQSSLILPLKELDKKIIDDVISAIQKLREISVFKS